MTGSKQDRATQILHLLLQKGKGSIEELAGAVEASPASVRRDLIKLEERGLVNRTHGGAEVAGKMAYEPFRFDAAFPLREERFSDEKRRIALAAAGMVTEGETVALSPGTTTTQIARSLRHREGIHIVTSAVNIGMELSSLPNMRVTLTGGAIRWPGSFSMVGATAFDGLQRLFFDKLFLGACGIHPQHGLTVIESDEALILNEMVKHTKQVSGNLLQVEEGSLYPALQRLLKRKLVKAEWGVSSTNRRVRTYHLTAAGLRHLEQQISSFERMFAGIALVLDPGKSSAT